MDTSLRLRTAAICICLVGLGACSGGNSTAVPRPVTVASATPDARGGTASVSFTLTIPSKTALLRGRRPDYVSAATNSAAITVTGQGASPSPAVDLNCTSGQTCSVNLIAPIGSDTFAVTLYSGTNATGSALGIGSATQTIAMNVANVVTVTLNGVVNSVSLAATPATVSAGSAAVETVTVNALDAAGDTIVSPGGYVDANGNPLTITVNKVDYGNGKGVTAFATASPTAAPSGPNSNSASTSGTTLTYDYTNNDDIDETDYTSSTSSAILGTQGLAVVTYVPTYVKEFADTSGADTNFIATGADGNLWFTDFGTGTIGSSTPTGTITHYTIPSSVTNGSAEPEDIIAGPNGTMYFAEYNSNAIGSISTTVAATTGAATPITETLLTTTNANPRGIVYNAVCSSNIWFTEFNGDKIGTLSTTTQTVTEYAVTTAAAQPDQIACGDDGNYWFTEYAAGKVGTITPAGVITEYPLPSGTAAGPIGIATGADGSEWVAEANAGKIARITTSKTTPAAGAVGSVTEYALPTVTSSEGSSLEPSIITSAPDGDLFFSEFNSETTTQNAMIGRIVTTSTIAPHQVAPTITMYPLTNTSNMPYGVTVGPDGHIWFVDMGAGQIGYLIY